MSGFGGLITGLGAINGILDKIKWLWGSVKKLFQKSPVKEFARKEKEADEAFNKAAKTDDTSDVFK